MDPLIVAIQTASDPRTVMQRVTDEAVALAPSADTAGLFLVDGANLTTVSVSGPLASNVPRGLSTEGTLAGLAMQSRETVHCEDLRSDPRVTPANRYPGVTSVVAIPLNRGLEVFGMLGVTSSHSSAFSADEVRLLARLGEFVTAVVAGCLDISRAATRLLEKAAEKDKPDLNEPLSPGLAQRERHLSRFLANVLQPGMASDVASRDQLEGVLRKRAFSFEAQPIVSLDTGKVHGVEALARFPDRPQRPPNVWFGEAARLGLGAEFELAAVEAALPMLANLDEAAFLAINLGPEALASPRLAELLSTSDPRRIVLELTEHVPVDDYPQLRKTLARVRDLRARLAVDDAGAGFASLGHILHLAPELVKLDREFSHGIDRDPARHAVAQSLVSLAAEIGAVVVAEGVETAAELDTIRSLGIPYAQGYFLSRPMPVGSLPDRLPHAAAASSETGQPGS